MAKTKLLIFAILLNFVTSNLFGLTQSNSLDSIQLRLNSYISKHPINNLYVHLDRNEYTPGDTIWLKAYMMSPMANNVLYTRITDKYKNILFEKQFPVHDIRSIGDISLPDTLSEGEYRFFAYMDRMINFDPENIFVQPFRVSKNIKKTLQIEVLVADTNRLKPGGKVDVIVRVKGGDIQGVKGVYKLYINDVNYKSGKLTTNNVGESTIRFTYPDLTENELVRFSVTMTRADESADLTLNLAHEGNAVSVDVFPEGGHLVSGLVNNLIFETRDLGRSPISAKIILMEGQDVVGQVTTNENGIGQLTFIPKDKFNYSLKVLNNGISRIIPFPCTIESTGIGLQIDVKSDMKKAIISNNDQSGMLQLLIRSFEKIVWMDSLFIKQGDVKKLTLPLVDLPSGILSLIVCDEMGAPKAERVFMNKSTMEYTVGIDLKRTVSKKILNVGVKLNIRDVFDKPVLANVSVAVVEKSTLNQKEYKTIQQSYYFRKLRNPNNRIFDEKSTEFDLRLKSSSWVNFGWDSIYQYRSKGPLVLLSNTGGLMVELYSSKDTIKSKNFAIKTRSWNLKPRDTILNPYIERLIVTPCPYNRNTHLLPYIDRIDSVPVIDNSYIVIPPLMLLAKNNENRLFYTNHDTTENLMLTLYDPSEVFDTYVKKTKVLNYTSPLNTYSRYVAPPIKAFNKTIQLKAVDVLAKGKQISRLSDRIGDYYCLNHVVNCPNHSFIEGRPKIGWVYSSEIKLNTNQLVDYNGPGMPFTNSPKEFVVGDVHFISLPTVTEPSTFFQPSMSDSSFLFTENRPTIYWNPNLNCQSNGEVGFDFNLSNERKGEYIIMIQGIDVKTFKPIFYMHELKQ